MTNVKKTVTDSVSASIQSDDKVALFTALPLKAKAKAIANANPKMAEKILNDISPKNTAVKNTEIYLQSAAFWYAPFLILLSIISWFYLKSIPMKASIKEQLDIFSNKIDGVFSGTGAAPAGRQ